MIGKRERGREFYNHAAEGDFWSLAAIMGAEELFYNRGMKDELLDLAYWLCPPSHPQNEQDERSLLWSGQIANIVGSEIIQRDTGNPAGSGGSEYLKRLIPRTANLLESKLPPRERAEAGDTLARLGDPRFDADHWHLPKESLHGFVHIPAGEFLMGTKKSDIKGLIEKFGGDKEYYERETEQHPVTLPDYYINRYPVTVAQFKAFVDDSEYKPNDNDSLRGVPNHPVVYVTWFDAMKYCQWLNVKLKEQAKNTRAENHIEKPFWEGLATEKLIVTLPSEAEWEKAARDNQDARVFPWGNDFDQDKANNNSVIGNTSTVGCFPKGKSLYEVQDMSGNVWEWTRSEYKNYLFNPKEKLEKAKDTNILRVLRGGAFSNFEWLVRCAYRLNNDPANRYNNIGFRVVVSPFF